ncbi:MAG: Crp/Fnr family transcriptional regulator [Acidimicrobiales bacterium]
MRSAVAVLDRDPDLGSDLAPAEFRLASRHALARLERFERGPWSVTPDDFPGAGSLGLLLLAGILVRKVTVGDRTCAELLGPGDVTQPWLRVGPDSSIGTEVNWRVQQDLQIAVLDRAFVARMARWPEVSGAITRRVMLRVHWLSFHLSVCHMRRVEDRLLLVLWHFADRWGKVTPDGVEIPLPLTHSLLAFVVGSHRPTVTTALRALADSGRIRLHSRSRWLLHGRPPVEFRQLHEHAADRDRPLPQALGV